MSNCIVEALKRGKTITSSFAIMSNHRCCGSLVDHCPKSTNVVQTIPNMEEITEHLDDQF